MTYSRLRQEMRSLGASRNDRAVFEISEKTGEVLWASDFALSTLGYSLPDLQMMTLVNLAPESLASKVSASLVSLHDNVRNLIWPIRVTDKDKTVAWWYVNTEGVENSVRWFSAQLVSKSAPAGEDFVRMTILMDLLNEQHDLTSRLSQHEEWTENQVTELRKTDTAIFESLDSIRTQQKHIISIARSAADGAMESRQLLKTLRTEMEDGFTNQMVEILKLIQTDALHDERIMAFDKHMKSVAKEAMERMETSAAATTAMFQTKATEAGKGLTRKVTIPVGMVAALMSGIQWLITNWDKIHFPHF